MPREVLPVRFGQGSRSSGGAHGSAEVTASSDEVPHPTLQQQQFEDHRHALREYEKLRAKWSFAPGCDQIAACCESEGAEVSRVRGLLAAAKSPDQHIQAALARKAAAWRRFGCR
jgi:hypothetical protein